MQDYCLALTGGIACGKSTVGDLLCEKGLKRVDSDRIARQVVELGTPGLQAVVDYFGTDFLDQDGRLDRAKLGARVFQNDSDRRVLEGILHPLIWESLKLQMSRAESSKRQTFFEIPLLFERGHQDQFSTIWVVASAREKQIERVRARDGLSKLEAEQRINAQMDLSSKIALADFIIFNNDDIDGLQAQIELGLEQWERARGV